MTKRKRLTDRERLAELLDENIVVLRLKNEPSPAVWKDEKAKILANILIANGVIYPPCKVGDTVYAIVETTCEDIDFVHTVCEFYNEEHEDLCTLPKGKCPYKYIIQKYSVAQMNILHFSANFGKTVFLSREEAEKALAERSKA